MARRILLIRRHPDIGAPHLSHAREAMRATRVLPLLPHSPQNLVISAEPVALSAMARRLEAASPTTWLRHTERPATPGH
ncbi:hypothetical protein E4K72_22650 [Oxalobacteraceae bacterium OM1]|nr:hypothetical protein E4K72_22650 [Oxalobacteraceae bacterium OM1]